MPHRNTLFVSLLLLIVSLVPGLVAQPLMSHRDLDWTAPRRWVHVDNVDTAKVCRF